MSAEILTEKEIAEIEARLAAATPGPWFWTAKGPRDAGRAYLLSLFDKGDGEDLHGAGIAAPGTTIEQECLQTAITGNGPTSAANAIFIAHAPADIARLLANLKAVRAELAEEEKEHTIAMKAVEDLMTGHEELTAALATAKQDHEDAERDYETLLAAVREAFEPPPEAEHWIVDQWVPWIKGVSGNLTSLVEVGHKHGWNGVENSKILAVFLDNELNDLTRLRDLFGDDAREQDINATLIDAGRQVIGEKWDRLACESELKRARDELDATKAKLAEHEKRRAMNAAEIEAFNVKLHEANAKNDAREKAPGLKVYNASGEYRVDFFVVAENRKEALRLANDNVDDERRQQLCDADVFVEVCDPAKPVSDPHCLPWGKNEDERTVAEFLAEQLEREREAEAQADFERRQLNLFPAADLKPVVGKWPGDETEQELLSALKGEKP